MNEPIEIKEVVFDHPDQIEKLKAEIRALPSQKDLDHVKNITSRYVEMIEQLINQRLDLMDKTIESLERQLATLAVAFGEQAVVLESLVGQLQYASPEEREIFHNTIKEKRQDMIDALKEGADVFSGEDPSIAAAVERLAQGSKINTSSE